MKLKHRSHDPPPSKSIMPGYSVSLIQFQGRNVSVTLCNTVSLEQTNSVLTANLNRLSKSEELSQVFPLLQRAATSMIPSHLEDTHIVNFCECFRVVSFVNPTLTISYPVRGLAMPAPPHCELLVACCSIIIAAQQSLDEGSRESHRQVTDRIKNLMLLHVENEVLRDIILSVWDKRSYRI